MTAMAAGASEGRGYGRTLSTAASVPARDPGPVMRSAMRGRSSASRELASVKSASARARNVTACSACACW